MPPAEPSWDEDPLSGDGLDWEALRAGGRLHLFCYLRDSVLALALPAAAA